MDKAEWRKIRVGRSRDRASHLVAIREGREIPVLNGKGEIDVWPSWSSLDDMERARKMVEGDRL